MLVGSLIVLALVAVLFGPFLIDWNGFRSTFEQRASDIFGQPVEITGDVDLTMLPSPTVTINGMEIGDAEGEPMATIDHVSIKLDLLPLLSGRYNISELILERPVVHATIDDAGRLNWLLRPTGTDGLDPERVVLDRIVVTDGTLTFLDARTDQEFVFSQINTNLFEAVSLQGPWRMDGSLVCQNDSFCGEALPITFALATGRWSDNGSLRVTTELTPASAELAGTLNTEGTFREEEGTLAYAGTFTFDKYDLDDPALRTPSPENALGAAWTIGGDFRLGANLLMLTAFSWESADGFVAITGDAALTLGNDMAFDANLVSRQIDLDRAFGQGAAATVADAGDALWQRLASFVPPSIPGRFSLDVPTAIVSGSVLQDFRLEARTDGDAWEVESLALALPGQSTVTLAGRFVPGDVAGFVGTLELNSELPQALGGWLGLTAGRTGALPAFAFSGAVTAAEGEVAFTDARLEVGQDALTGDLFWREDGAGALLVADVTTESFGLETLRAVGDLFAAADTDGASRFSLRLDAAEIVTGNTVIGDVAIDAEFTPDEIAIAAFTVGDLDGAEVEISGTLTALTSDRPQGALVATVNAGRLDGVIALANEFVEAPDVLAWLERSGRSLAPLTLEATIETNAAAGFAYQVNLNGIAGATTFRAAIDTDGLPDDWAMTDAAIEIDIDAVDVAELARQVGLADPDLEEPGPATIDFNAAGVPANGMAAHLQMNLAGAVIATDGTLTIRDGAEPAYVGPITVNGDLDPVATVLGVALPNPGAAKPAVLQGEIDLNGALIALQVAPSSVMQQSVEGALVLDGTNGRWAVQGELMLDEINFGWLTALQIGVDPLPGDDPSAPWSRAPFLGPLWGDVDVDLDIDADRLIVGEGLAITNADLGFSFGPDQARFELRNGSLFAGLVRSTLAVELQDGQVDLDGQLILADVPIDAFVWRSEGQPVAEGVVNFSAGFAASGRSMAGLISSLSGSGTVAISQGLFRFMGSDAFDLIIRLSDQGETMDEEALRVAFTGFLDAGTLAYGDGEIAFDIAAGTITPRPIIKEVDGVRIVARAPIDLTRLQIDSSWELTLVEGRGIEDGPQPSVFVTFAGPLANPVRRVNVTPLAGYLAVRRLQETERLEDEILERERFIRTIERIEAEAEAEPVEPEPAEPAPAEPEVEEAAPAPPLLIPGGL